MSRATVVNDWMTVLIRVLIVTRGCNGPQGFPTQLTHFNAAAEQTAVTGTNLNRCGTKCWNNFLLWRIARATGSNLVSNVDHVRVHELDLEDLRSDVRNRAKYKRNDYHS